MSWHGEVQTLVADNCVTCHGGDAPAGDYALDTYLGALGPGSDETPNAIAGDAGSTLLTALTADHLALIDGDGDTVLAVLTRWVVDSNLALRNGGAHAAGVLNPRDETGFHGVMARDLGYDVGDCARCHGAELSGDVGPSCTTCHVSGTDGCDSCHAGDDPVPGDRPAGAHATHLAGSDLAAPLDCARCHQAPTDWLDPGHFDGTAGAEVRFSGAAVARGRVPTFDAATGTCSDVACHVGPGGSTPAPVWSETLDTASCTTCHSRPPPAPHVQSDACYVCHNDTVAEDGTLDALRHVNGMIDVRGGTDQCNGCHGDGSVTTPLPDPHAAHLAAGDFSVGLDCTDCHAVPDVVEAAGHLDGAPVDITFGSLASSGGLTPTWDRTTWTCSDVWCHAGPGGGNLPEPTWSVDVNVTCGNCHSIPPTTTSTGNTHPATGACVDCHPRVIDAGFNWVDPALHLNGTVEVGP